MKSSGTKKEENKISKGTIATLDEQHFMQEVAERLNAFIGSCPKEAQNIFGTFIKYEHELIAVHQHYHDELEKEPGVTPTTKNKTPGVRVGALIGALLQTHYGNGWVLSPIIIADPECQGRIRVLKFEVKRQDPLDEPQD